ncbi:hypothetical protein AB1Y20_019434 [Prymnesium parvum]|uniref:Uncharacterized protein n=1 Tax=Prymnesium parvum TaxID=97485 RepID=A0AB34JU36_PRYPA
MALVALQNAALRESTFPLRVCQGSFPQRVPLDAMAAFYVGGCAFSRDSFSLAVVMLFHPFARALQCDADAARPGGGAGEEHAATFVHSARPFARLLGRECAVHSHPPVLVVNCSLLAGDALACMRRRRTSLVLTLGAAGLRAPPVDAELLLSSSTSLRYIGGNATFPPSERRLLWADMPPAAGGGEAFRWDRLAAWSANWSAAGFGTIQTVGPSEEACHTARKLAAVGCEARLDAEDAGSATCLRQLYNTLGLYYARAAAYTAIGFVGVDERPDVRQAQRGMPVAPSFFDQLQQGGAPFVRLAVRGEECDQCQRAHADEAASPGGPPMCKENVSEALLTRFVGIPSRMHSPFHLCNMKARPQHCDKFEGCILKMSHFQVVDAGNSTSNLSNE